MKKSTEKATSQEQTAQKATAPNNLFTRFQKQSIDEPKAVESPLSLDEISETPNSHKLFGVNFQVKNHSAIRRQEKGMKIPCIPTHVECNKVLFLSRQQDTFGHPTEGVSMDIYGYDLMTDVEGDILYEDQEINGEIVQTPVIKNMDDESNPLEPRKLMHFRPQYGRKVMNRGKNAVNELNLSPGRNVPRLKVVEESTQKSSYQPVDWSCMPGLEGQLEKILLQVPLRLSQIGLTFEEAVELPEDDNRPEVLMAKFLEAIPLASNAPSLTGELQSGGVGQSLVTTKQKVNEAIGEMSNNAFDED